MTSFDFGLIAQAAADEPTLVETLTQVGMVFLTMFLPVILAFFLGRFLAKVFKMENHAWRYALILCCAAVAVVVIVHRYPPKFGVDLRGGVNIIGELDQKGDIKASDIVDTLRKRIDPGGVREIVIRPRGEYQIEVIIPDVDRLEAERTWETLATAGQLLFRIVASQDDPRHAAAIRKAREVAINRAEEVRGAATATDSEGPVLARWYSLARIDKESKFARQSNGYLYYKFLPNVNHICRNSDTGELVDLQEPHSLGLLDGQPTSEADSIAFTKWCENTIGTDDVEILMIESSEKENVEGKHLINMRSGFDQSGNDSVHFGTNGEGSKRLGRLTNANKPKNAKYSLLGIVLDGQLDSAPRINSVITDQGIIQGRFSKDEVDRLVATLKSGKLDVTLKDNWISLDQVESTLGNELKQKGFMAIGISMLLVLIFMVFYYRYSGVVACIALLFNLVFILALILLVQQALTLAGLAGLVLTVGMSVDANVLIFERIREELGRGAALRMAIRNGFDRATTTIVDANLTTLITAVILYLIGTETIKSFAVTLIFGIIMGMFTAIFCSRVIFELSERRKFITRLSMMRILSGKQYDFLSKKSIAAVFSILVIIGGLVGVFFRGQGVLDKDLRGGTTARIVLNADSTANEVKQMLAAKTYTFYPQDEKVTFDITPIAENARNYIVNSNLPAFDEGTLTKAREEGKDNTPTLDQILTEVFQGKLDMLQVDFDPNIEFRDLARGNNTNPDSNEGASNRRRNSDRDSLQIAASIGAWNPAAMTSGMLVAPATQQENQDAGPEMESATGEENQESETPVESEVQQDDPETVPQSGLLGASTILKFKYPLTIESVKGGLVEAASDLGNVPLDADDIEAEVQNQLVGMDSVQGTEWKVELKVSKHEDAARAFTAMKQSIDASPYIPNTSAVGGQIADQARWQALTAMLASLLGIIAYVWVRFQNIAFGLAAVVALIHDVLVVLGAIALSQWISGIPLIDNFKISLPVIAAFLTIIGYSLNDTIVVFDRIREVRGKRTDLTAEMINSSISQTLSRTILTSITTFIVVFILFVFGGDSIHAFAYALVIGVIVGTYSSIFVASPTLLFLMNWGKDRKATGPVVTTES